MNTKLREWNTKLREWNTKLREWNTKLREWTLNLENETLNLENETLNLENETLNLENETLNLENETLNLENETLIFTLNGNNRIKCVYLNKIVITPSLLVVCILLWGTWATYETQWPWPEPPSKFEIKEVSNWTVPGTNAHINYLSTISFKFQLYYHFCHK